LQEAAQGHQGLLEEGSVGNQVLAGEEDGHRRQQQLGHLGAGDVHQQRQGQQQHGQEVVLGDEKHGGHDEQPGEAQQAQDARSGGGPADGQGGGPADGGEE
jgi:hypothetical protein